MNFLSHYFFDRKVTDANQILGMVLPDLVKNANKSWNPHPEKKPHLFNDDPALKSLLVGWERHLKVDRYFHSSPFFTHHTQNLRTAIAPIIENSPVRPSFLAHIALELMLDSLLITGHLIDPAIFYEHLSSVDRNALDKFLQLNDITETANFFSFFDEFISSRYLFSYRESHNMMYALNRICMRVWDDPLNETQKLQLSGILLEYQNELESNFMSIFDEITAELGSAE